MATPPQPSQTRLASQLQYKLMAQRISSIKHDKDRYLSRELQSSGEATHLKLVKWLPYYMAEQACGLLRS